MAAVHLSIVSHGQGALVQALLSDLAPLAGSQALRITVTLNVPEPRPAVPQALQGLVDFATNDLPRGFGANHNRAFKGVQAPFFCVMNPDLRLPADPFAPLLGALDDPSVALAAPAAVDGAGRLQDNARRLPSPGRVLARAWSPANAPDYAANAAAHVEVVAGFFMLFRSSAFAALGGFDERYFLYYEDFDLCCRLRIAGGRIAWIPSVRVVHEARRTSHRNPRYLAWHAASILRFFSSAAYRSAKRLPPLR